MPFGNTSNQILFEGDLSLTSNPGLEDIISTTVNDSAVGLPRLDAVYDRIFSLNRELVEIWEEKE